MKTKNELKNNIHVMKAAMNVLDNHFTFICPGDDACSYGQTRQDYLKKGIAIYESTSGQDKSVVQSLLNLFSAVRDRQTECRYGVVLTDIRDELTRISYDV